MLFSEYLAGSTTCCIHFDILCLTGTPSTNYMIMCKHICIHICMDGELLTYKHGKLIGKQDLCTHKIGRLYLADHGSCEFSLDRET